MLVDGVGGQGLEHVDEDDEDEEGDAGLQEVSGVLVADAVVEGVLDDERLGEARAREDEDREGGEAHALAVRFQHAERPGEAPAVAALDVWLVAHETASSWPSTSP